MAFNLDDFVLDPQLHKLDECTKADLLIIAKSNVCMSAVTRKPDMKLILKRYLAEQGVLWDSVFRG